MAKMQYSGRRPTKVGREKGEKGFSIADANRHAAAEQELTQSEALSARAARKLKGAGNAGEKARRRHELYHGLELPEAAEELAPAEPQFDAGFKRVGVSRLDV